MCGNYFSREKGNNFFSYISIANQVIDDIFYKTRSQSYQTFFQPLIRNHPKVAIHHLAILKIIFAFFASYKRSVMTVRVGK